MKILDELTNPFILKLMLYMAFSVQRLSRETQTATAFILSRFPVYFFCLVCVLFVCCFFPLRWICAVWVGRRHHTLVICWWNSHMGAFQHWVTITVHLHRANGYPKPTSKQTGPLLFSEKTSPKSLRLRVWKGDFLTWSVFYLIVFSSWNTDWISFWMW